MRNSITDRTPSRDRHYLAAALLVVAILAQGACGGGSSGSGGGGGAGATVTGTNGTSEGNGEVVDDGSSVPAADPPASASADFPFAGTFVADEYSPSIINPQYEGIVEIVPSPLSKTRILQGNLPRAYPDGRITFRQGCGQSVARIALAEPNGLSTPITPCSSEIPNEGASPTNFGFSHLSPDGTLLAVEAIAFLDGAFRTSTLIFEVASQTVLATWQGGFASTWTPDGRLLMASNDGLFLLDEALDNPTRLGEITGPVNNPDVSLDGSAVVFEFNQQIWGMNMDGTDPRELLSDGSRLRYPTWAPDGSSTIAFLAAPSDDKYLRFIFAADLERGQVYSLSLDTVLEFPGANYLRTINGPLSWNP